MYINTHEMTRLEQRLKELKEYVLLGFGSKENHPSNSTSEHATFMGIQWRIDPPNPMT